jgi:hypothetical protein
MGIKPVNDKYNFQGFQKKPIGGTTRKQAYDSYGDFGDGGFDQPETKQTETKTMTTTSKQNDFFSFEEKQPTS